MVTIIIPSRNEQYTAKTVKDLLAKATGDIEIYIILDGWWLKPEDYNKDPRVNYIHYSKARGMRNAINSGVSLSRGDYIMKTDAHCMFDKGFDEKLVADCEKNWIVIPRRYPLDPEKWVIEERTDAKYPIDVMNLDENLQGKQTTERKDNSLIRTPSFQGSCWFMRKDYFHELKLMDEDRFGGFWQEAQEMGIKCQQNGGMVMRNTKTWYAHWHKTKGRGYSLNEDQKKTRKEIKDLYDNR